MAKTYWASVSLKVKFYQGGRHQKLHQAHLLPILHLAQPDRTPPRGNNRNWERPLWNHRSSDQPGLISARPSIALPSHKFGRKRRSQSSGQLAQ